MVDSLARRFDYASKVQYEMGEIDKLNRLVAETKAMQIKNMLNENLADIGIAENELKILLNTDQEFLPPEDALIRLNVSISGDSAWISANPAMRALNQQINVLEASVKNEKMKAFPDLKVGYFNQSIDHTKGFQGWQVAVKVPLWYWSYDGNIQASKIQQEIAQNTLDYEQKSLYLRMQQMQQRIEKYRGSVNFYEEAALAQSDQLILVANMSYYEGEIGYIEYINNVRDAIQIKLEYLDALNNYNQTVIEIEYLLGNPGKM